MIFIYICKYMCSIHVHIPRSAYCSIYFKGDPINHWKINCFMMFYVYSLGLGWISRKNVKFESFCILDIQKKLMPNVMKRTNAMPAMCKSSFYSQDSTLIRGVPR